MSRPPSPSSEVARFLRQRSELGAPPIVLTSTTRSALLEELAGAERRRPVDAGARPGPPPLTSLRAEAAPETTPPDAVASGTAAPEEAASEFAAMDYEALREAALACTRCGLAETRTHVVFADGAPEARLVVVGEAPGANEDRTGLPFVGAAGKLLDLILASVDLSREESVHICNVLKCRPPGNRNPHPDEIRACAPFLARQLALVQPDALLAVGSFAAQLLTGRDEPLGRLRGEVHAYEGIPLVVTYHPAALLRNSGWVRPTWDDLQLLRQVMDG